MTDHTHVVNNGKRDLTLDEAGKVGIGVDDAYSLFSDGLNWLRPQHVEELPDLFFR